MSLEQIVALCLALSSLAAFVMMLLVYAGKKTYDELVFRKQMKLNTIYLSREDSLKFAELLENPPEPNENLKKLFRDNL